MSRLLLTNEVAKMLRVGEEYIRELARQRKLKACKIGRRGGYRFQVPLLRLNAQTYRSKPGSVILHLTPRDRPEGR